MLNPKKIWLARLADLFLRLGFRLLGKANTPASSLTEKKAIKSILVLESHLLGDTVMSEPVIRCLHEAYPSAELHLVGNAWASELFSGYPYVTGLITTAFPWITRTNRIRATVKMIRTIRKLRKMQLDLSIETRGDLRNILFLWCAGAKYRLSVDNSGGLFMLTHVAPGPAPNLSLQEEKFCALASLGIAYRGQAPLLHVDRDVVQWVSLKYGCLGKPRLVLHPGASLEDRRMASAQAACVIGKALDLGFDVALVGAPSEKNLCQEIASLAKGPTEQVFLPLRYLKGFLQASDLFLGTDSGPGHLAAAVGLPVITLVERAKLGVTPPTGRNCFQLPASTPFEKISDISPDEIGAVLAEVWARLGGKKGKGVESSDG